MTTKGIVPEQDDMDLLLKVMDCIIPPDDFPSASQAGVDGFLLRLWGNGSEPSAALVFDNLRKLNLEAQAAFGIAFVDTTPEQQDQLFLRHAGAPWFVTLCELVAEGYYSNPGNGSNPASISWRMVGYDAGLPEGPDGPPPNEQDMVSGKLCA